MIAAAANSLEQAEMIKNGSMHPFGPFPLHKEVLRGSGFNIEMKYKNKT